MKDLVTRLILDNKNFNENLHKSESQIKTFEEFGKSAVDMLGKFAGAAGIAVGGVESFTAVINSNATSQNAWNDLIGTTKTSIDNLFSSIANGDWSVWENGITNAISLSRKYVQALREMKSNLQIGDVRLSQEEKELNRFENIASDSTNGKGTREQAFKDFKQHGKETIEYIQGLSKNTNDNLSTMLAGKGVKSDKNVREMIFNYLDTSTFGGKQLSRYKANKEELKGSRDLLDRYMSNGNYNAAAEQEKKVKRLEKQIRDAEKNNPQLIEALKLRNSFTDEEVEELLDYTDRIIGLEDRTESLKKQISDLSKDFTADGKLIQETNAKGSSVKAVVKKSEADKNAVHIPTQFIVPEFRIPETTLRDLETERDYIIKKMNTANQSEYIKLKAKLDIKEQEIKDFKSGGSRGLRGRDRKNPLGIQIQYSSEEEEEDKTGKVDYSEQIEGLNTLATSLQTVSNLTSEGAAAWMTYGANILTAVAAAIPAITGLTAVKNNDTNANVKNAATGAAASQASIPIVGPILAVAAVASVLAALMALPKFATGGIVAGNKTFGDLNLARVNSGEMILNNAQQRNLFAMLNGGATSSNGGGRVEFKIQGKELVGVLNNYNNKRNKVL